MAEAAKRASAGDPASTAINLRVNSDNSCAVGYDLPARFSMHGHSPTDYNNHGHPAEEWAARDCKRRDAILHLVSLLPSEVPARGEEGLDSHSFTSGAYSKNGQVGMRRFSCQFPQATKALTSFVREHAPKDLRFGAVALFTNLASDYHIDVNNEPGCPNWICPISKFAEGAILVEDEDGTELFAARGQKRKGKLLQVSVAPVLLDSQRLHRVLPWQGKQRTVLVAFMPRCLENLEPGHRDQLLKLGFRLQPEAQDDGLAVPSRMIAQPQPMSQSPMGNGMPYVLEIFCGTAGVASAFQKRGCDVLGVDHVLKPRRVKAPAVRLDMTNDVHQGMILREIERAQVVFLAPPCGTAFRAREIPIPGRHGPKPSPLRSMAFPQGLPGLSGVNAARVSAANRLYEFTCRVFRRCKELGRICIVENPTSSLMWEMPSFKNVAALGVWCNMQACSYGSTRNKRTSLLSTHDLPSMHAMCDGTHSHEAWGRRRTKDQWSFATTAEAEYPAAFCAAVARDVCSLLEKAGWQLGGIASLQAKAAQAAQRQARHDAPMVGPSEYLSRVTVTSAADFEFPAEVCDSHEGILSGVPVGSKLLQVQRVKKGGEWCKEATFGIYRTPDAFVAEAMKAKHPFDNPSALDDSNMQAMANILTNGVEGTIKHRKKVLEYYERRALELEEEEKKLKNGMAPEVRKVVESKKILLFKEMLRDAGIKDENLVNDLVDGFRITGELQPSGLFQRRLKPAALSHDDLKTTAKWAKHTVASSCRAAAKDPKVAAAVWDEALEQVDKGWLRGPFSWSEIDAKYNGVWIGSKRFGILQGEKIRAIDDLSEFLVNSSVTETEKINLEGIDQIVATARFFSGAVSGDGVSFELPRESGGTFSGRVHKDFAQACDRGLVGRALDLRSAYKQLARHPEDAWATVLAVYDQSCDEVKYFEAVALPFGAVSSVTGFNRTAKALKLIMSRLLWLVNTSYYDDFTQMEIAGLAESASKSAERLMDLLGWEISRGDKLHPLQARFNILGVSLDLSQSDEGVIRVHNKEGRLESLWQALSSMKADRAKVYDSLASFKGRLLFATNHVFGRCAQICTQLVSQAQKQGMQAGSADGIFKAATEALNILEASGPREIARWGDGPPVLIFTDGACEENGNMVTHGAVMFDPTTGRQEYFGDHVPRPLVQKWAGTGKKQLVFYAEILPVVVAKATWRTILERRTCLYFIDNEAARACFVRYFTPVFDATSLLLDAAALDMQTRSPGWYCRVPSKSNIADDASRLEFGRYGDRFMRVQPDYSCITCAEGGGRRSDSFKSKRRRRAVS